MKRIDEIRSKAAGVVVAMLWVNATLVLARSFFAHEVSALVLGLGGVAVAGAATSLWFVDRIGPATRFVSGAAHAVLVGLLVYGFTGSPLQIDMHMYFFAMLAVLTIWVDWRPIATFTLVTALHHLVLYVALPAAVFPGSSDFSRVVLHAVVLLLEAGMLYRITQIIERSFGESEAALAASLAAQEHASQLSHEAEAARVAKERERQENAAAKAQEAQQMQTAVVQLGDGLGRLAEGDLTVRLQEPFVGALDQLRTDFNLSVGKLRGSLQQIQVSAISIDESAGEIRSASDHLLLRTEQQAASLEETSSAFEEITRSVRQASDSAQEASRIAGIASAGMEKSRDVVTDAVEAMNRIQEASSEIAKITDLIDGIAFQTNLLALNAGVEAARAGEAGQGFAVVAQEVRALAQRSAGAATDIKSLIRKSGAEVANGVNLVNAAGESLEEISAQVISISERITAIADMAKTQATSLTEINSSVGQIDQITQKNAAMVEESTAVTHRLAADASALSELVRQFRLKSSANGARTPHDIAQPIASPARQMVSTIERALARA